MYFTSREKRIMSVLASNTEGVNVAFLEKNMNVSKRTLYRDLSSIEQTLDENGNLKLEKEANSYRLVGNDEYINTFKESGLETNQNELSAKDRRYQILLDMLLSDEVWKLESFSYKYGVSVATVQNDLQQIEKELPPNVVLKKEKGYGSYITCSESDLRMLLIRIASKGINDYHFFEIAKGNIERDDSIFTYISVELLKEVYKFWKSELENECNAASDVLLKQLLLLLTVTLQRSKEGNGLSDDALAEEDKRDSLYDSRLDYIYELIVREWSLEYSETEKNWLACQLVYFIFPANENAAYGSFFLEQGYRINELIKYVCESLNFNYISNNELMNSLSNHIFQVMNRPKKFPYASINPIPEKNNMMEDYQDICIAAKEALDIYFSDLYFSESDLFYIVLYFSTFFKQKQSISSVSILVVCSYGIGLAEILKNRIESTFPEAGFIKCIGVSGIETIDLSRFDLVLSTNILKDFRSPYTIVSPFLFEDDIKELKLLIKRSVSNKQHLPRASDPASETNEEFEHFNHISILIKLAEEVIEQFKIEPLDNPMTIEGTLERVSHRVYPQDTELAECISQQLMNRMYSSPLGLPNTNLGLFHCLNERVRNLAFRIYELRRPISIIGFDEEVISLKRVILIIGKSECREAIDILSKVSITVAENAGSLEIFNHGTEEEIKRYLKKQFISKVINEIQI